MAFTPNFVDLVRNYTTTSGTDDFALGPAVNGFTSFSDACAVGDCFYYSALGVDNPGDTEVGRGTLMAGGIISRDPISGKKTNFKTGTKSISLIAAAEWFGQTNALVGTMSPVGQALMSAPTASDARAALALGHIAVNPAWYGLIEGDDPANGAANSAAFASMLSDIAQSKRYRISMPAGTYWFADTIDISVGNLLVEGAAGGGLDEISSILRFPAGVTGIRIQNELSSGATTKDSTLHSSGGGTLLRNLALQGSFATAEAEAHGVQLRDKATLENLTITNFQGDGIHIAAGGAQGDGASPPYGNANMAFIIRPTITSCRNGIFFDGMDANACTVVMPNINLCRQWGIFDGSFLGNTFLGGQLTANGAVAANDGVTIGASQVSFDGRLYGAVAGQEDWCSVNSPSGTTADNQGWYHIGDGAPATGSPAWTSGMKVRAGGCIHDDSLVGASFYSGIYVESDQGKAQITQNSLVAGGILANWCYQNPGPNGGAALIRGGQNNGVVARIEPALEVVSGAVSAQLGYPRGNSLNFILNSSHSQLCPPGYQLQFASSAGSDCDIRFTYAGGAANAFWVTTPTTREQFGTGAPVANAFAVPRLMIHPNAESQSGARRLMIDVEAPASGAHGQGEWCLYRGGGAGLIGWKCVAPGTPGTWEALYSGYGTGPVGYSAGAGGAVAQGTSKASAVTIDKLCGQITMIADALPAGEGVAFTVNNAEVAPTDIVELVLASGHATAGTYTYQVDRVGAGSFTIWVKNVSAGTLGEALVFNFAIKKAVAA